MFRCHPTGIAEHANQDPLFCVFQKTQQFFLDEQMHGHNLFAFVFFFGSQVMEPEYHGLLCLWLLDSVLMHSAPTC